MSTPKRHSRPTHLFGELHLRVAVFEKNSKPVLHLVLGGWQLSGITNIEQGRHRTCSASYDKRGRNGNRAQLVVIRRVV